MEFNTMILISLEAIFVLLLCVQTEGRHYKSIECPFPDGQSVSTKSECRKYAACDWGPLVSEKPFTSIYLTEDANIFMDPGNDEGCFMKDNGEAGYRVTGITKTSRGEKVTMKKIDPKVTLFHGDVRHLVFEVINHEDYHVQIKIYDNYSPRYEVPITLNLPDSPSGDPLYIVHHSDADEPFAFSVGRRGSLTEDELFKIVGPLTFEDQFIQLTTTLPTTYMYGMGENTHKTFKHIFSPRQTYPIFPRDHEIIEEVVNLYGHQPYYVIVNPTTEQVHSVLFYNSNAMEYSTFMLEDGSPALTLRTIGGIVDLHIFLGPSLEDVNRQYVNMIGLPAMPPYWALGFQLSRDGYRNPDNVREVRKRMRENHIPQDVQFFDVNYMYDRRDFTYDTTSWKDLPDLIEELHNESLKVTIILDPPIASDFDKYPPAQRGKDLDIFIKWLSETYIPKDQDPCWGTYMVGRVWPSYPTVFPDFLNPTAQRWWGREVQMFREILAFDGLWIDMNEVTNFGTNPLDCPKEVRSKSYPNKTDLQCPYNRYDSPPYPTMMTRTGSSSSKRISETTLCMSGNQTDGRHHFLHYDVHSLYGWSHTVATYRALRSLNPGLRPMILTRSTFPGSGQFGFHWLGDNASKWEHMKMSIIGILEFNLFGIPMVGADICGFNGEATMEVCARWMQLGAFYPYSRNHNCGDGDQDPAVWPEVARTSRLYLGYRYRLLPYLYSLFRRAHLFGETVVRPIFSQFLSDTKALEVDDQFFWGDSIMVAPVLMQGAMSRDVYFPKGVWYDIQQGRRIVRGPATLKVEAPLDVLPLYALGGCILPLQNLSLTTSERHDFGLAAYLDSSLEARGEIFWDDGESDLNLQAVYLAKTSFSNNTLKVEIVSSSSIVDDLALFGFQLYGYPHNPKALEVNGVVSPSSEWHYDGERQSLIVQMHAAMNEDIVIIITIAEWPLAPALAYKPKSHKSINLPGDRTTEPVTTQPVTTEPVDNSTSG